MTGTMERAGLSLSPALAPRTCERCGERFDPNQARQRFCGAACAVANYYGGTAPMRLETVMGYLRAVVEVVASNPGITRKHLRDAVAGKAPMKDLAIQIATERGDIRVVPDGRALLHFCAEGTCTAHETAHDAPDRPA